MYKSVKDVFESIDSQLQNKPRYYLTPALKLGRFVSTSGNLYNIQLPSGKVVAFRPEYLTFVSHDRLMIKNGKTIVKLSPL